MILERWISCSYGKNRFYQLLLYQWWLESLYLQATHYCWQIIKYHFFVWFRSPFVHCKWIKWAFHYNIISMITCSLGGDWWYVINSDHCPSSDQWLWRPPDCSGKNHYPSCTNLHKYPEKMDCLIKYHLKKS